MVNLPTLLIKGKLVPHDRNPDAKKLLDEWTPIEYIIDWFRNRLSKTGIENRVLILKSETASGKSTAFPPELYRSLVMGAGEHAPGIICTQPRVLTAIENVNEMLKHYSKIFRRGETIGWSTKYNKLRPKSYGLLSATIGTLTQQLRTLTDEEILKKYRFILIDETHERDLQTDMTLYMLKNLLLRNQNNINCPFVVLMSATFDPKSFLEYFKISIETNFIWCEGATAKIDEMWDWNQGRTVNDYTQAAAEVVEKIVTENPDDPPATADILIFMPGKAEFAQTARLLVELNKKLAAGGKKVFSLLKIEAVAIQTQNEDYKKLMIVPTKQHIVRIDGKNYTPGRRVIICTNVAETGLTLDNLKYVIDAGYNKEIEFNPILGIRGLITKPAPRSRIRQRRGRAGRKFPGVFYPLYPLHIYEKLQEIQFPQILIEDISAIALDIINEQLKFKYLNGERDPQFDITSIDMVDVPTPDALSACLEKLYSIGFVSPISPRWSSDVKEIVEGENGPRFSLTKLGALASSFNMVAPESVRMILAAYSWGASILDMVTIAAYLAVEPRSLIAAAEADSEADKPPTRVNINWTAVYKSGLPGFIASPGLLYKMRLLLADDFIDGLVLFNAIKYTISSSESRRAITNLRNWCAQNRVSYRGALSLIRTRDDIIEQMLTAGFETFAQENRSLVNTTEDDFMDTITRIKYCIYDGYRNNILIRTGTSYKTMSGLEVVSPKIFRVDEVKLAEKSEYGFAISVLPTYVLYRELSLKYNMKTSLYTVVVDQVSTCDGFVNIDPDFLI